MKESNKCFSLVALAAVAVLGLSACSKTGSSPAGAMTAAPAAVGGKVGIPECDDYIDKYQKCLSGKVPAAAQAAMKAGFDQTVDAWQKTAATPEGKTGLAMACKAAIDGSKQAMNAYGCEW